MGSEFVQDPWAGTFATGLANAIRSAPKQALDQAMTVEQIWALREKRARDTEIWNAGKKAVEAYPGTIPEATVDPSFRDVPFQPEGPANPKDIPKPDENLPLGNAFLPATTTRESYIDPALLKAAQARRNLAVAGGSATILKDPSQWAPQQAYGQVAVAGMPVDPRERARLQFQTTGRFPTSDETKLQGSQNYAIWDANGPTGRGYATRNGVTTLEGVPIASLYDPRKGERAMEAGSQGVAKLNPIENQQTAQNNFNQLAGQIREKIARGELISHDELNAARAMRDTGWAKKIKFGTDPETGRATHTPHYDIVPPEAGDAAELFRLLDRIDGVAPAAAPAAAAAPPAAAAAAPAAPGAAVAADPLAAVPPPPAPRSLVGDTTMTGAGDPKPVVAEYLRQPVVNSYENAKVGYSTFISNVPFNNQTSDLAMIVGAAKILDPPSVVREGEVENVRKTGGVMDRFIGQLQGLKGEARLPAAVRMQLWNMVHATMEERSRDVKPIYEQHAVQLRDRQVDPKKYLPELRELRPVDISYVNTKSGRTDSTGRTVPATTAPAARATGGAAQPPPAPEDVDALRRELGGG